MSRVLYTVFTWGVSYSHSFIWSRKRQQKEERGGKVSVEETV